MPAGRPPQYNLIQQAKDLDKWSKKEDSTALVQFCNQQDIYPDYIYEWRDKCPEFSSALKKAKSRIAERLRKKLHDKQNPYNYGLFMSELGFHDKFYHDYQESLKNAEAERRKAIEKQKESNYTLVVTNDLATGASSNIPTKTISEKNNPGSK